MNKREIRKIFEGKKITQMGLGLLGRGVGDAEFMLSNGAILTVTDLKTSKELKKSVDRLKKYKKVKFVLGKHQDQDFIGADMIMKSAGIPFDSEHVKLAQKHGAEIQMSTALFSKLAMTEGATIIGVTGTRGKSTVSRMIYEILREAYNKGNSASSHKVWFGGNIKGMSTLALIPKIKKGDLIVLELDSWQLQGFGYNQISPSVAVFTNFMPDHLNYYRGNLTKYFNDKAEIFKYQKKGDALFCGSEVWEKVKNKKYNTQSKKYKVQGRLPSNLTLRVPGEHNRLNALFAYKVAKYLKINEKTIVLALSNYRGMPGRLEFVKKTKNGVLIYNDTNSTTPMALKVAVSALNNPLNKNPQTILIAGGADKSIDLRDVPKSLQGTIKALILLPGTGTDKLKKELTKNNKLITYPIFEVNSLKKAVIKAIDISKKDDRLLFSPGFASFGMFLNEYDRGEKFIEVVSQITNNQK